jgi:hypothetical protein
MNDALPLLVVLGVAAPLAAGAVVMILGLRRGPSGARCGRCRYDVSASVGGGRDRCPECGALFVEAGITPPRRRRPALVAIGAAMLLLSLLSALAFTSAAASRRAAERARAVQVEALLLQQRARVTDLTAQGNTMADEWAAEQAARRAAREERAREDEPQGETETDAGAGAAESAPAGGAGGGGGS